MNRKEFIEECSKLSNEELFDIVKNLRKKSESRIQNDTKIMFHALDDQTTADEIFYDTAFGKTHLYAVKKRDVGQNIPVIINVHGGGWSLEHTERDIYFSRRLAYRLDALVFDVDYVLAPEYPYPAALEEMEALFNKLPELIALYGGDSSRVVLCGQSAGGNIVGAVMERSKFKPIDGIKAQILCYLPTDNYNDHFGEAELDDRGKSTEYYGFFYNRNFEDRKNFDVSLVYSDTEKLKGLIPTDIITAGLDSLKNEGEKYYELLKSAGVNTSYKCFEESRHGFLVNLYDEWKKGEDYVISLIQKYI